jgi:hypothetical protein
MNIEEVASITRKVAKHLMLPTPKVSLGLSEFHRKEWVGCYSPPNIIKIFLYDLEYRSKPQDLEHNIITTIVHELTHHFQHSYKLTTWWKMHNKRFYEDYKTVAYAYNEVYGANIPIFENFKFIR